MYVHIGASNSILAFTWPLHLQYFSGWMAVGLFVALGALVVLLGRWSLAGLGPVRKWVAISLRLLVVLLLILIIGGVRWQRTHKDVEVLILSDLSDSIQNVTDYPGNTGPNRKRLETALDDYYRELARDPSKQTRDRIGLISFGSYAKVDAIPNIELRLDTRGSIGPQDPIKKGTNIAKAIQLALATMSPDAMHRLVLVSDGNATQGSTEAAYNAAAAQHVPIDVVPLKYDVRNEVLVDRFEAPSWKRENEPFTLRVVLRSTGATAVSGKLRVQHITAGDTSEGATQAISDVDMDPTTAQVERERAVSLHPGLNVELVRIPALNSAGVHRFKATFTPDKPTDGGVTASVQGTRRSDLLDLNRTAEAFTFVHGTGQVLYIDNTGPPGSDSPGLLLAEAMARQKIKLDRRTIDGFPQSALELQAFDAIVLANVPRGSVLSNEGGVSHLSGLSPEQDKMLSTYVHEMGGGLVMIGGPDAFGAGGWEGSEVEKILPVDMAIPAQRQIGKGALVLVMHSCEMPQGNYWGEQCARQAIKALSSRDEIGIISYDWGGGPKGGGIGGAQWDYTLAEKGDGAKLDQSIRAMQLGDMPSFDDAINLAINGSGTSHGLKDSTARHKHIIIISDGDPAPPQQNLINQCRQHKISISTVTVYPHMSGQQRPPVMNDLPRQVWPGGKAYGPIESNPQQLPQIFIKEATIVKRSLIHEEASGIPLKLRDPTDDTIKGVQAFPSVRGMVLTSRKHDPKVEMPLAAGAMNDPILAHWQAGLGKTAVWTSDATRKWAPSWVGSDEYDKLWAQMIRSVSRPAMSPDFDVRTTIAGNRGEIVVEALNKEGEFANFLNIAGTVGGGAQFKTQSIRLTQTGPGMYKGSFTIANNAEGAPEPGSYVAVLRVNGKGVKPATLLTGSVVNGTPELRDLRSNEQVMEQIRQTTGGRLLEAFDPKGADLFSREGLTPSASPMPIWDVLIPFLLALIILDVAVRRIAWDWNATKRLAGIAADRVRSYTMLRRVEGRQTLDALKRVREDVAQTKLKPMEGAVSPPNAAPVGTQPDPKAKFEAKGAEGDITQVVGGATNKPVSPAPKKGEPKAGPQAPGDHLGGLMAAKKRAQQQIKEKEQGEDKK